MSYHQYPIGSLVCVTTAGNGLMLYRGIIVNHVFRAGQGPIHMIYEIVSNQITACVYSDRIMVLEYAKVQDR